MDKADAAGRALVDALIRSTRRDTVATIRRYVKTLAEGRQEVVERGPDHGGYKPAHLKSYCEAIQFMAEAMDEYLRIMER